MSAKTPSFSAAFGLRNKEHKKLPEITVRKVFRLHVQSWLPSFLFSVRTRFVFLLGMLWFCSRQAARDVTRDVTRADLGRSLEHGLQ